MNRLIIGLLVVLAVALAHPASSGHFGAHAATVTPATHAHDSHAKCDADCERAKIPPCCASFHFFCGIDGVVKMELDLSATEWQWAIHEQFVVETFTGLLPEPRIPPPRV